jgi:hypothetical protein
MRCVRVLVRRGSGRRGREFAMSLWHSTVRSWQDDLECGVLEEVASGVVPDTHTVIFPVDRALNSSGA